MQFASRGLNEPALHRVLPPATRIGIMPICVAAMLLVSCSSSSDDGGTAEAGGGTAGMTNSGGAGGSTSLGGAFGSGGALAGGAAQMGGRSAGGSPSMGGSVVTGGSIGLGGASTGGSSTFGGARSSGGAISSGGAVSDGGMRSSGGSRQTGGSSSSGGVSSGGASAAGSSTVGPCDIYEDADTPCVAAHSTVRALYGAYDGPLYQLRRADQQTKDVPVLEPGGFVDISVQDDFCSGSSCTISIIYDQSPKGNDLGKSPPVYWLENGGVEANAAQGQITVSGHVVHGIYVTGYSNVAYRNNATNGIAINDEAESMYMVVDGKRFSDQCCFDYGNAETTGNDDGNGTMEAVYFGNDITWGGQGEGNGPWVAADLENGVYKCDQGGWQSQNIQVPEAKSIIADFATVMLKGPSGNSFAIKGGSAQSGTLTTMWDGNRPSPNYSPKSLQGAIILGTGGDGSNGGTGTFFEGAMTMGNPPDSVDEAIQANIVAAGYGR